MGSGTVLLRRGLKMATDICRLDPGIWNVLENFDEPEPVLVAMRFLQKSYLN